MSGELWRGRAVTSEERLFHRIPKRVVVLAAAFMAVAFAATALESVTQVTVNEVALAVVESCRGDAEPVRCLTANADFATVLLDRTGMALVYDDGNFVYLPDTEGIVRKRALELWEQG